MESLRPIFPNTDPTTLQQALEAHNNSIERTVDYLLSTPPTTTSQIQSDATLAALLQAEETHDQHPRPVVQIPPTPTFQLPSLDDLSNAVRPVLASVTAAGRVAAAGAASLYRDFLGDSGPAQPAYHIRRPLDDEAIVLRGEATSSPSSGPRSVRARRSVGSASTGVGKKDS